MLLLMVPQVAWAQDSAPPATSAATSATITWTSDEPSASTTWWNSGWNYRKRLIFDNSGQTENLANFTVLVKLTPARFTYAHCETDGSDIRFVDANESTPLSYHFEKWTYNGTSWIWVEVPQIDGNSSADYIWLYYGNSAATDAQDEAGTYDANFMAVWHLHDDFLDSANNNDGTNHGSTNTTAKIADGQDFNGTSDYVDISGVETNISVSMGTIDAWINMTSSMVSDGQARGVVEIGYTINNNNLIALRKTVGDVLHMRYRVADTNYNAAIPDISGFADTWKHIVGVWNATYVLVYEDGALKDTVNRSASPNITLSNLDQASIGADAMVAIDQFFEGAIDEVRISDVARSADWIKAQYLSMTDAFVTFVDIYFYGWGWCPDERRGIGNVSFPVTISAVPRVNATEVSDIRFVGTLNITYSDNTTRTFALNLTGVKVRSLFYLKQHELDPANGTAWGASFKGTWLTWEEDGVDKRYLGLEGKIWLPHGEVVTTVKPYYFLLRTPDGGIPEIHKPDTTYIYNLEYIIGWLVGQFDALLTELSRTNFWDILGDMLDRATVIIKEVRDQLDPYIP